MLPKGSVSMSCPNIWADQAFPVVRFFWFSLFFSLDLAASSSYFYSCFSYGFGGITDLATAESLLTAVATRRRLARFFDELTNGQTLMMIDMDLCSKPTIY